MQETMLITGSRGFIGSNLAEYFRKDYVVLTPSHQELDLLNQQKVNDFLARNPVNFIINCASVGATRKTPVVENTMEKNLRIFFNLSESHDFDRMIHFGSGAEYDKARMPPKVKENDFGKFIPADDYGFSKYVISKYIERSEKIFCLRLFGVFGPHEDYEFKFISNAIVKNLLHMPIRIMQNVFFDWLYIDDLLCIVEKLLKAKCSYRSYNLTTGKTTDLTTIAEIINKNSDFKSEIIVENEKLNAEYSGANDRLLEDIGPYKFLSMDKAIIKLSAFYSKNLNELNLEIVRKDPYVSRCIVKKC